MLRIVPHTVPRVGRSYEHFPDGFELHLLQCNPPVDRTEARLVHSTADTLHLPPTPYTSQAATRWGKACLSISKHDHFTPPREIKRHVRALARNHPEGWKMQGRVSPTYSSGHISRMQQDKITSMQQDKITRMQQDKICTRTRPVRAE
jgi:hypothetical protein